MPLPKNVKLLSMPDGFYSDEYVLTIGKIYEVVGRFGPCVIVNDDEGKLASIPAPKLARID